MIRLLALLIVCLTASSASAQIPQYRVLVAPTQQTIRGTVYNPAALEPVARPRYAYGWFGAKAQPQPTFHRGYYRDLWFGRQ